MPGDSRAASFGTATCVAGRTQQALGGGHHLRADLGTFPFLALIVGVWTRKIVGWSMANHLKTDLVLAALETAIAQRQPKGVICRSDHCTQYTSIAFNRRCQKAAYGPRCESPSSPVSSAN